MALEQGGSGTDITCMGGEGELWGLYSQSISSSSSPLSSRGTCCPPAPAPSPAPPPPAPAAPAGRPICSVSVSSLLCLVRRFWNQTFTRNTRPVVLDKSGLKKKKSEKVKAHRIGSSFDAYVGATQFQRCHISPPPP